MVYALLLGKLSPYVPFFINDFVISSNNIPSALCSLAFEDEALYCK